MPSAPPDDPRPSAALRRTSRRQMKQVGRQSWYRHAHQRSLLADRGREQHVASVETYVGRPGAGVAGVVAVARPDLKHRALDTGKGLGPQLGRPAPAVEARRPLVEALAKRWHLTTLVCPLEIISGLLRTRTLMVLALGKWRKHAKRIELPLRGDYGAEDDQVNREGGRGQAISLILELPREAFITKKGGSSSRTSPPG
jgi:hypothetical protein